MAIVTTVEQTQRILDGKTVQVTITKMVGRGVYKDKAGNELIADGAIYADYGPKHGTTVTILHDNATEEGRAARNARLCEAAARVLISNKVW